MTNTSSTASPGQVLSGRYRLEELIASGGMAQVWQATDEVLQRRVAVKVLHAHLASDESFVARFRVEAVAAAKLRHASIVSIYDTCSSDGMQAIVMELVKGENLRQRLDQVGTLSPREAVHVGVEVADALAAAHRAGLVHRDIKPANIMLCDDHRVVVTDFGIAKVRGDPDLTQTGLLIGSVKYLAPEQVEGKPLDGRCDIYSLGVVLYEALCGRPPFHAESDAATALARLQSDPPRPRQLKPGIPRGLEAVVVRAMARDPAQRYQTAADLRAALLAAPLTDEQPGATPTSPPIAPPRAAPAAAPRPAARPAPAPRRRGPAPVRRRPPRRWVIPTLVIVLVGLCLALAGVLFARTDAGENLLDDIDAFISGDDTGDTGAAPAEAAEEGEIATVPIVETVAFDPEGDNGDENGATARNVSDGDTSTVWSTEGYNSRSLPPLKSGVGVYVVFEEETSLDRLEVTSASNDWAAQVYVAPGPGQTIEDWGDPVAEQSGIGNQTTFELGGAEGGALLLWITNLGDGPPKVKTAIAEMTVVGS